MDHDIYDPAFVADVFDKCSANYRRWSAVASFGLIHQWRRACVAALPDRLDGKRGIDLMAGTGEVWPHLFRRHPKIAHVTAMDISRGMHDQAMARLHHNRQDPVDHLCADVLTTPLAPGSADFAISCFGLKTFNADQHIALAQNLATGLTPGAPFAFIEATDPRGWWLRPAYRLHLDIVLPRIERWFLRGAQDFAMIGTYTRNFGKGETVATAFRSAGLDVSTTYLFGGCAVIFHGTKPVT